MARFIKHIIAYGDTLQGIAQARLGSLHQWQDIVELNDLKYPYIVDTVEEKMENKDHLLTIGDTVLIQLPDTSSPNVSTTLSELSEEDKADIYALSLGKDFNLLPSYNHSNDRGGSQNEFELQGSGGGSLDTNKGIENLKQAMLTRLLTPVGSYIGHPNYGSYLHRYVGRRNTPETAALINLEIERTLKKDGRVQRVRFNRSRIQQNSYSAHFTVYPMDLEDAFEFIVGFEGSGPVVLRDDL
jgi:phage baseplate assembly protein W